MKLTAAVLCVDCNEVYDGLMYRVCPACASAQHMRIQHLLDNAGVIQDDLEKSKKEKK